ncbi:hypothetical protein DFH09DRAFT_1358621 [Mycena vulgaris]|nr:hypothetical protein DFH09DRAFT_1358621 [Mycena vulgaris]
MARNPVSTLHNSEPFREKFQELFEEEHIDKSQLKVVFDYYSWNCRLCIATGLLACLSIAPYIRLIMDDKRPGERFGDPDNHVAIHYTLASHDFEIARNSEAYHDLRDHPKPKLSLFIIVLDLESRITFALMHRWTSSDPSANDSALTVYSATSEIMQDIGIMTVKCGAKLPGKHEFRNTERFTAIAEHSQGIANCIGGIGRVTGLRVSWGLNFLKPELDSELAVDTSRQEILEFATAGP